MTTYGRFLEVLEVANMRSVLLWFAFYISTHCGVGADIELYPVGTPDDYPLEELSVILREKPELFVTREQLAAAAAAAEAAAEAEAEAEAAAAGRREYPREASSLARLRLAPAPDAVGPAPQYAPRRQPAFSYREPAGQAADGQPAPFAVSPEDPRFYEEPRAQSPELDGGGGAYRAGDFGFRVPSPEEAPPRPRPDVVQGALEQAPPPPAAPPAARDADEEAWRLRLNFRQAQQPPLQQQQQAAVASAPTPAQQEAPPPDTKKKASQEAASSVEAEAEAAARAAVQAAAAAAAAPQADMAAPPVAELRGGGGAGAAGAGQVRPAAVANPFEDEDEEEAEGPAAEVLVPQASKPQRSSAVQQKPVLLPQDNSDLYFIAIVAGCCAAAVVGIIAIGISWYRLQKSAKAAADVEYPAYGVTGPNKDVSPTGDRRLAQSAQMYHYQHQKQQIIAMERRASAGEAEDAVDAAPRGTKRICPMPPCPRLPCARKNSGKERSSWSSYLSQKSASFRDRLLSPRRTRSEESPTRGDFDKSPRMPTIPDELENDEKRSSTESSDESPKIPRVSWTGSPKKIEAHSLGRRSDGSRKSPRTSTASAPDKVKKVSLERRKTDEYRKSQKMSITSSPDNLETTPGRRSYESGKSPSISMTSSPDKVERSLEDGSLGRKGSDKTPKSPKLSMTGSPDKVEKLSDSHRQSLGVNPDESPSISPTRSLDKDGKPDKTSMSSTRSSKGEERASGEERLSFIRWPSFLRSRSSATVETQTSAKDIEEPKKYVSRATLTELSVPPNVTVEDVDANEVDIMKKYESPKNRRRLQRHGEGKKWGKSPMRQPRDQSKSPRGGKSKRDSKAYYRAPSVMAVTHVPRRPLMESRAPSLDDDDDVSVASASAGAGQLRPHSARSASASRRVAYVDFYFNNPPQEHPPGPSRRIQHGQLLSHLADLEQREPSSEDVLLAVHSMRHARPDPSGAQWFPVGGGERGGERRRRLHGVRVPWTGADRRDGGEEPAVPRRPDPRHARRRPRSGGGGERRGWGRRGGRRRPRPALRRLRRRQQRLHAHRLHLLRRPPQDLGQGARQRRLQAAEAITALSLPFTVYDSDSTLSFSCRPLCLSLLSSFRPALSTLRLIYCIHAVVFYTIQYTWIFCFKKVNIFQLKRKIE